MTMRFLCLHGMGTNSDIFESQIEAIRSLLPTHFDFTFMDGEHNSEPADGMTGLFPPPYLCYYPEPRVDRVFNAIKALGEFIEEEGPFDAVIGFSQGASLAASFILECQTMRPTQPLPFRFAMFICSSLPFSSSLDYGIDVTELFAAFEQRLAWKQGPEQPVEEQKGYFQSYGCLGLGRSPASESSDDSDEDDPRLESGPARIYSWHPLLNSSRIKIPSAHIYGRRDPYISQSKELVNFCSPDLRMTFDHGGGHEIPRSTHVAEKIVAMIERMVEHAGCVA